MSSPDWSVYESQNYDGTVVSHQKPKFGLPGIPKKSWMKRWLNEGMRRTVKAVFVTHIDCVPHLLLFQQADEGRSVSFLYGGKLAEGESEREGLTRILRGFILKDKSSDSCEWKVGEVICKYYRPEFDERIYPLVPAHVTRPKEEISVLQVVLPPKCVFALRESVTISAVPFNEILRNPQNYSTMIASLPSLISRFTLYNYVSGRPPLLFRK
jgi:cleavage and polyadenylation specificity factor subunit 5